MLRKLGMVLSQLVIFTLVLQPIVSAQSPGLVGGNPNFNGTVAEEEGYWYSRYNMGTLTMASSMGDTFMPDPAMIQQMIQMADANPNDGDGVMLDMNTPLIQSVFASGDPHFTQMVNDNDVRTMLWNPATFDRTVTTRAMGWTMIKEAEWAKQFHVDAHFGIPTDNFGAQWRFVGLILMAEAKMQIQYTMQMLVNHAGLITNSDGRMDWGGQWVMLEALSDLAQALGADAMPHSTNNRYLDIGMSALAHNAADNLFQTLRSRRPADTEELSLAIQALTWYGATTNRSNNQNAALAKLRRFGNALSRQAHLVNSPKTPPEEGDDDRYTELSNATGKALAIRGLMEAYRNTGRTKFLTSASMLFSSLVNEYDAAHGIFTSQSRYTIDDVAVIMGALNSLRLFAGSAVDLTTVEDMFTSFFESAVNMSGLQQSAPPKNASKGSFEQDDPDIFYAYPGLSVPPLAGEPFGIAPVFGTEVTWDGNQWHLSNGRFDSAGAMHAANEFIWFHNDEVNGFPVIAHQG